MSQILDDCAAMQTSLSDASAKADAIYQKITTLESQTGATQAETDAVVAANVAVIALRDKLTNIAAA